ncbi:unnamed protein product [Rangifer tarandus platyrhynchus]|uniref:Uncharacterized protein n=2 Tax=Rangifer tarandus platyrhynchus TaxID=3082113 RepID=A0AC59Z664_RANTA|nr:unnamed protein product [Rangifer tarandus platyrhynchus]
MEACKKKRHSTLELPLHESPGNSDALPGLKISSAGHLTHFIGGDPEAGVSRVSRPMWMPDPRPSAFPQCPAPRGPPCKHCPHSRTSLKLPASKVFAVGAS